MGGLQAWAAPGEPGSELIAAGVGGRGQWPPRSEAEPGEFRDD